MGMEAATRQFFIRLANSIALLLLWMIGNLLVGIYWKYAFPEHGFSWKNGLYFLISVASFVWLFLRIKRSWKW